MERCTKRRRLSYAPFLHAINSSKGKITAELTKDSASNLDLDSCIAEKRALSDKRLKATFESIFEKYGKDFEGIGDEIDIATGEIVVNNGHLLRMQNESDVGDSLCFGKNEKNLTDGHSEDSSTLSRNDLEPSDYQDLEREKNSDLISDVVTLDSEKDCIEDDLILRGFSQVNRLSKCTSEEASCQRISTIRRGFWTSAQTPDTLRASCISNDKFFSRIKTLEVCPGIFERSPNYAVRREDDLDPARQIPKQLTLHRKYSIESNGKVKSSRQSALRAGKSLHLEPVESFCSSIQQRKNIKLNKVDSRVYKNEVSLLELNKTERSVRSYVNGVCQNYIFSLRKSKPQNLRKQETLSKSSSKNCPSVSRDSEKYFGAEAKRIRFFSKIRSKNVSNKKSSAQLQPGLFNNKPEVIKIPFKNDHFNITPVDCSGTSLKKFKHEKPQPMIPAHNISESYLSSIGSAKAHETCKPFDSDSPTKQTKNENVKSENNNGLVHIDHKIINQPSDIFDSHENLPLLERQIQATRKQFHPVSPPRTQFGNNCTKDGKANSGSRVSTLISPNGPHVNQDLSCKTHKFEDLNIPRVASCTDSMNEVLKHPNSTAENSRNASKKNVARAESVRPQGLTYSDFRKNSRFKCTDLESELISKSSISISKSDKTHFELETSRIQNKNFNIKCAANNLESSAMAKEPFPSHGFNGKITTSYGEKPCINPRFYPDVSTSQPSFQDFYLTPVPARKRGEKQKSMLKVTNTYETPKRTELGPESQNASNNNSKSILSTNASKLNKNRTKLGRCYLPTPTNSSEASIKSCLEFDEHSRPKFNKTDFLSPVNQKLQHKLLAENALTTHQSLSLKSENRAKASSSIFLTETQNFPAKERKRSPREDGCPQEFKDDTPNKISSIKKGKKDDILSTERDFDLSIPRKLLKTGQNLTNGVVNTSCNHEKPETPSTAKEFPLTHAMFKVLPEQKHRNSTCGVMLEDITQASREYSCRSLMKTSKDLIEWPPNSEEIDELSFDFPDKGSTFALGPRTENNAFSSPLRVLSTIKRKRKISLINSIEESDADELGL
ncbi:hypothetical protein GcM1_249122 [Golovinomyces cichoracearum]|uniref:Uncharacterized protein n=1 Tax=Golovinomyces cichoracearum TaxID=62708 RepID=A0A420IBU4_9PEZI|nr:hypothetical protein GcM1_249122 [Golovinomyces cichoracearum]